MNRFNNFFLGAATLVYHSTDIFQFFTNNFDIDLNLKLESVMHDCNSTEILALARALGILYYKVTYPFWLLLQDEDIEYVDQYCYIQEMYDKFKLWSADSTSLMARNSTGIFEKYLSPRDEVFAFIFSDRFPSSELTKNVLQKLMASFIKVTERQLSDFLPGGTYSTAPSEDRRREMKHCKLTNLIGEYEFGDLDFGMYKRRNASLFYHSSIQMLKRNRTISKWLYHKNFQEQQKLLKYARSKASLMREKYRTVEKDIKVKMVAHMNEVRRKKAEKLAAKAARIEEITNSVKDHGGPCSSKVDVDRVLATGKTKTEQTTIIKDEIRYQTSCYGKKVACRSLD